MDKILTASSQPIVRTDWPQALQYFVKVTPHEYRRALDDQTLQAVAAE